MATVLILILSTALGVALLWAVNQMIDGDGRGRTPAPRSHHHEQDPRPTAGLLRR
jgi:hypothetical protein